MEEEEVLKLIDSYWFNREILKKSSKKVGSSTYEEIPSDEKIYENRSSSKPENSSRLTLIETRRSMNSETGSNDVVFSESVSPDSVVPVYNKEAAGDDDDEKTKKLKKSLSKSLSELEFEEVKGFMDLGFVFSEEDKDSSLDEIIPGLQRRRRRSLLMGKEIKEEEQQGPSSSVARPYLSEAWEVLEMMATKKKRNKNPLINWKVPNSSNEIDMKDSLRWWAHTVASTVK